MTTNSNDWEVVIGLELHAQVTSNSKLFSDASTEFGAAPNSQVTFVDSAMPGMLPVLNKFCVEQAVRTGLGINAHINKISRFDRKNYFYPDLPSGYQISQFYHPIVGNGILEITLEDGSKRSIGIERIHLEQDAGKSMHDQSPTASFIDLNRAGIALMEIVSKPDLRSAEEAIAYVKKIRTILRYLGTCDGDMEKGSLRCDANVSVRRFGAPLGTRAEIKNLNSFKFIAKAIEYEVVRQIEVIEEGGKVVQETRLYDSATNTTRTMRDKEDALDYRYFPEPDLPPVVLTEEYIAKIKASMPELPDAKIARYQTKFGLSNYDAELLTSEPEIADYFEEVAKHADGKLAANWIGSELFAYLNRESLDIVNSPIRPSHLAELINLITDGTISGKIAKQVFEAMCEAKEPSSPKTIVEEQGLVQVSDPGAIKEVIDQVIAANPDKVTEFRAGKDKLFGFFVGQVMKLSGGKANPQMLNDMLKKALSE